MVQANYVKGTKNSKSCEKNVIFKRTEQKVEGKGMYESQLKWVKQT